MKGLYAIEDAIAMSSESSSLDDFEFMDIAQRLSRMDQLQGSLGAESALTVAAMLSAGEHARSSWTAEDETETKEDVSRLEIFLINSYNGRSSSDDLLSLQDPQLLGSEDGACARSSGSRSKDRYKPRGSSERPSLRRQEKKVIDTVLSIYSRLKSKQRKIARAIESSVHEEASLSSLLNLSDKLSSVLDSAGRIIPEADAAEQRGRSDSTDSTSFDMNQLMSIMYKLRMGGKGQRAEIAKAASALGQLCRAERAQQAQIIDAMKQVGGLQLLLSALTSYHDWEDVEMQISKVIAVLVMNEDDWQMLQRLAFEILSALYTLTIKLSARMRGSSPSTSDFLASLHSSPRQAEPPPAEEGEGPKVPPESFDTEQLSDARSIVAGAVAQVTRVLCGEWRHSDNLFMWGAASPVAAAPSTSSAGIEARRRSRSNGGAAPKSDFDKLLEAILNIVATLNEGIIPGLADGQLYGAGSGNLSLSQSLPRGARPQLLTSSRDGLCLQQPQPLLDDACCADDAAAGPPTIDDAAVLCAIAVANLAEIPQCRTSIVSSRVLTLLHCWVELAQGHFQELRYAREEWGDAAAIGDTELVSELLDYATAAIMSVCGGATPSSEMFESFPVFSNDYTVGYIDAQVINGGLPAMLVQFLVSSVDSGPGDRLTSLLPPDACTHLLTALSHLCSRQKNRMHGMQTGVPFALCKLFACLAASFDAPLGRKDSSEHLESAAAPSEMKRSSSFTSNKSSRGSTCNFDQVTRQSFRSSSQLHAERSEEDGDHPSQRLLQQITTCLDGLSFFNEHLEDTCFALDGDAFFDSLGRRTLIDLLSSPAMVSSLGKVVANLQRCPARLACLRVVNCLTHFPLSLRVLGESGGFGIMESLVLICSEAGERHRSPARATPAAPAEASSRSLAALFARQDRGGRKDRAAAAAEDEGDWFTSDGGEDDPPSDCLEGGSAVEKEETLVVCNALANICCYDKDLSKRLYTKGLLPLLLPLAQSRQLEISRQTVRCISAMASVISTAPSRALSPRHAYDDTLSALTHALKSSSALVQREAVAGIANLCSTEEHVRDAIVVGPLKGIVSILSDYKTERAMRDEAERVMRNLGFREGARDAELVSFDTQLLSDWFNLKMSLEPQLLALRVIERWIADDLFRDPSSAPFADRQESAYGTPSSAMLDTRDSFSSQTVASSYDEETASLDKFYSRLSRSDPSPAARAGRARGALSPLGLPLNQTFKELQRTFFDSLQRLQNFCYAKPLGLLPQREEEGLSNFGPGPSHSGRASPPVTESSMHSRHSTPAASPLSVGSSRCGADQPHEGVDRPPATVGALMDLLLPSRLHQTFFVGLMALLPESCVAVLLEEDNALLAEGACAPTISMPAPYDVSTLYLPRRAYTFKVTTRVLRLASLHRLTLTARCPYQP